MNPVEASVTTGYHHNQSHNDNSVGETKHWAQSRTVRAVAGVAVLALGGLAGLAVSFFASPLAAIIAAGAVTAVLGVCIIGYFYHHRGENSTTTPPDIQSPEPISADTGSPEDSIQPSPSTTSYVPPSLPTPSTASYVPPAPPTPSTASYVPPAPPTPSTAPYVNPPEFAHNASYVPSVPPPYSAYAEPPTSAGNAAAHVPSVTSNPLPDEPPPAYTPLPGFVVADPFESPPPYKIVGPEEYIQMQETRVDALLRQHGETIYRSGRDGNCLYDAAAHQCPEIARDATDLRQQVARFAREWQQRYPDGNINFSPIEARAYARLQGDVGYVTGDTTIANGLDEIAVPGCFSDHIDTFFLAQVAKMPVIVIDIDNNVTIAVDENGQFIDCLGAYDSSLVPQGKILLVRDGPHFMGRQMAQN
ncbi:hypothetical protein [Salinisphaera sp. G21_0]|uniref:OTU domain-containing protein n=1 Tax=Salinisphaera sp. G21_0 TaxID=2821094 RepID=UPI001ADAD719|nr:hypothetical protein [Salinisphaera sp. G21_0]MBO9483537.1 hypothetical protein [Salinisphaera sp. G21_0]